MRADRGGRTRGRGQPNISLRRRCMKTGCLAERRRMIPHSRVMEVSCDLPVKKSPSPLGVLEATGGAEASQGTEFIAA